MKLVTFSYHGRLRIGEIVGERVYTMAWADSMTQLIRRGIMPTRTYEHYPLVDVTLEAPLRPGKMFGIGLNYADHAQETGKQAPPEPLVFPKMINSVIGINQPITWRRDVTDSVDYEGELAVVIGRRARYISEENALAVVFGYTIANDVSARDLQKDQWTRAKGLDTFCPLGPVLVSKDEIPDPHNLAIKTTVNGDIRQDSNTRELIFKIPTLIAYLSRHFTLEPGDVILTGTPAGVGFARNPPLLLGHADVVEITIEQIGTLVNPCLVENP
jgi:5-carboxymethyl-2-hydroxymuconate isomerase